MAYLNCLNRNNTAINLLLRSGPWRHWLLRLISKCFATQSKITCTLSGFESFNTWWWGKFHTDPSRILLDKLLYYGIKETELACFKSYLTNRTQFVSYNGTNSRTLYISTGVPQGSILGPLLFIIYTNDIHNASSKFHAILFVDDTNLISTLCSFDVNIDNKCNSLQLSTNINKELKNIQIWLEINKLSLNVKKTKFMIFHHKQRNIENLIPPMNLNEQIIERVTGFDSLGLTIDQHLTWNGHAQKISNKISRSLGIMCKLKRFYPKIYWKSYITA